MSKIVEKYIELDELFKQCTKSQFEGDFQMEQMQSYYTALDNFLKEAKNHYSNDSLDLNTSIYLFQNDLIAQNELMQHNHQNEEQTCKHL